MSWFIGILTFLLVIDCLLLILLVLVQLPKKEAGMGQAFGGGTTDALFGAGSGNALTKMTKYATAVFFVLTLGISVLFGRQNRLKGGDLRLALPSTERVEPLPPGARTNAAATATNQIEKAVTNAAAALTNSTAAPAK